MKKRNIYKCAFSDEEIDIDREETVIVAGETNGKKFECYVRMDKFFEWFVNHPETKCPLPGLTPYKNQLRPLIRWKFDPARFGSSLDKWQGAGELFNSLMRGDKITKTCRFVRTQTTQTKE